MGWLADGLAGWRRLGASADAVVVKVVLLQKDFQKPFVIGRP